VLGLRTSGAIPPFPVYLHGIHNDFTFIITTVIVVVNATITTSLAFAIAITTKATTAVAGIVVIVNVTESDIEGLHLTVDQKYGGL
jgi:hypothetical protein